MAAAKDEAATSKADTVAAEAEGSRVLGILREIRDEIHEAAGAVPAEPTLLDVDESPGKTTQAPLTEL